MNGVIYCRVSSKEQVEGTSLESQELACREYAERNRIDVLRVFVERGESAKFADRTQLLELLAFCQERKNAVQALLVWKVDRLARNVGDHFSIKAGLLKQDIRVISVTEPIDTNPEGKLLETILAGFAQFDNDLRAARTLQGMRRKIQEGLFPWKPPLGYKTVTQPGEKKTKPDIPDQPLFRLLQRAWQQYATGAYTKVEILRLMTSWGVLTKRGNPLSKQTLDDIFRDPFYAGVIRNPWTGDEHPGRHIPLVSRETFAKVQAVISRRSKRKRREVRPELPLRLFARCPQCERYVTGGLSRGRSQYYPYYRCFRAECEAPGSYRADVVHAEFTEFLVSITPASLILQKLIDAAEDAVKNRASANGALLERRRQERQRLDQQREQLIQMRMEGLLTNEEFTSQKTRIGKRIQELDAEGSENPLDERRISSLVNEISEPLTNLAATWWDISPLLKQRFQQSILPVGFSIGRIRTAPMSRLFSVFYEFQTCESALVHLNGQNWNQIARELHEFVNVLRIAQGKELVA